MPNRARELERKVLNEEVSEREDFSAKLIEASVDGIFAFDRECHFTLWNPAIEKLTGKKREEVLGRNAFEAFPFLIEVGRDRHYHATLAGETAISEEVAMPLGSDQRLRYVQTYFSPLRNDEGEVVGGLAVVRDTTEKKLAQDEALRLNRELEAQVRVRTASLELLAEAGVLLSSSLDPATTRKNVVTLASRYFEGGCFLRILSDMDNPASPLIEVIEHRDPEIVRAIQEHQKRFPPDPRSPSSPQYVIRTGEIAWRPVFPTVEEFRASGEITDPDHLALLSRLALKSYLCVPLQARGQRFGALSVISSQRCYTEADLKVARDLASRFAVALDNARLFEKAQANAQRPD